MPKKFRFTKKDLDELILEELGKDNEQPQGKPNVLNLLLAKARLQGSQSERTGR